MYIGECLDSLMKNDTNLIHEILVIDGMSNDNTTLLVESYYNKIPQLKLLLNKNKIVPCALNMGLKIAKSDFIMRIDAHSKYPMDYVSNCLKILKTKNVDCVGGVVIPVINGNSISSNIVRLLTTSIFGVGNSDFRLDSKEKYSDTVPFGFFKKSIFQKIGYFDERLERNQDYEFNKRIILNRGKIWLDPRIKIFYKNQNKISGLLNQAFKTGKWNTWMWIVAPYSFAIRHAVPLFFVLLNILFFLSIIFQTYFFKTLSLIIIFYFFLSFIFSLKQVAHYGKYLLILFLPFCFYAYHMSYGIGVIKGALLYIIGKSKVSSIFCALRRRLLKLTSHPA